MDLFNLRLNYYLVISFDVVMFDRFIKFYSNGI